MVLGGSGLPSGLGGGNHMDALVTAPWSKPLLVTGVEAKAWPGVGKLYLGGPSAHSGGLGVQGLTASQN